MDFKTFLGNFVKKYCKTHDVENDESLIWDYVYELKEDIQDTITDYFDEFYDTYFIEDLFNIFKEELHDE